MDTIENGKETWDCYEKVIKEKKLFLQQNTVDPFGTDRRHCIGCDGESP